LITLFRILKNPWGPESFRLFFSISKNVNAALFFFLAHYAIGQRAEIPVGLAYNNYKNIAYENLPEFDYSLVQNVHQKQSEKMASEIVAYNFKTHFIPTQNGIWKLHSTNYKSWFLKLHSKGAYGIALVFSGVTLKPGEKLFIYNLNGFKGVYDMHSVPHSGVLPIDFIKGEEIVIEYDVPITNTVPGTFVIETVSHAYRNIFVNDDDVMPNGPSKRTLGDSDCYSCLEGTSIDQDKRAVVKLVVHYENSTRICTGTLLNNTAEDRTPYILTAHHCVSSQYDADRTIFIFNYDDQCGKQISRDDLKLNGAYHHASLFENDFSVLELYDRPPLEFQPYYAGWDVSDQHLNEVTCVHHPRGGSKQISLSNGYIQTSNFEDGQVRASNAFWKVTKWDMGATEGGSSGAPLFNKNHSVIGTLSGGSSECGAPYNDYFSKLSASWESQPDPEHQLKRWLDPFESGITMLEGMDPFKGIHTDCETMSNVKSDEPLQLVPYETGSGYFGGYNSDNIASYAEKFTSADSALITGVFLNIGSVNINSPGGLVIHVQSKGDNGLPDLSLYDTYVPYDKLKVDPLNYVAFYPYVKVKGDFFISYTLSYSPDDTFALQQVNWRNDSNNSAFLKLPSGWVPMNTISPNESASALGIQITSCKKVSTPVDNTNPGINFYPNPAASVLIGKLPGVMDEKFQFQLYDLQGKKQSVGYNIYDNNLVVNVADLSAGMYIIKLTTSHKAFQSKFVKH
jgi:lysyl endopeptidase